MSSWPARALLLAGAAALLGAIPASSQEREAPESLLPPGFGDPEALPPPENKAQPAPRPAPGTPAPAPRSAPGAPGAPLPGLVESDQELEELERPRPTNYFSIPEGEARPVDRVGRLGPGRFGLAPDAFGRASGPYLGTLMQRLDAPLPSRWASILLRRALLSRLDSPRGLHPVDWVAARADLLLRMGEADAARMLVQSVDRENYTPRMIGAAARTALATADPAGLCPLVGPAGSDRAVWALAEAMCAALEGEPARASSLVDEARRRGGVGGVDFLLAEKIVGAGASARRAANIEWQSVDRLSAWRFGLAGAAGAEIPDRLVASAPLAIRAWFARAPMIPLERRLGAASVAASLGVFSSASLVELHSLMLDRTDPGEAGGTVAARLRAAWADPDPAERLEAMRGLWREPEAPHERHARLILTAGAAARIAPSADHAADAADLIASMLTAGLDRQAAAWSEVAEGGGDQRAWALLALAAPRPAVDLRAERIESYLADDDSRDRRRSRRLVAALAGLGRIGGDDASRLGRRVGLDLAGGAWARAIDRAARDREPGTVVLLAGIGMQTSDWSGVPAAHLYRILRALRAVGLDFEARMIAAEAIARL